MEITVDNCYKVATDYGVQHRLLLPAALDRRRRPRPVPSDALPSLTLPFIFLLLFLLRLPSPLTRYSCVSSGQVDHLINPPLPFRSGCRVKAAGRRGVVGWLLGSQAKPTCINSLPL